MRNLDEIFVQLQKTLAEEKDLDKRLDALEDTVATIGHEQAPEPTRPTLRQSSLIRAELEKSRRFWVRLSTILAVALVICISVILLNFYCW